jgi:hypothetical protein
LGIVVGDKMGIIISKLSPIVTNNSQQVKEKVQQYQAFPHVQQRNKRVFFALRIRWGNPWEFKSPRPHHQKYQGIESLLLFGTK